MTDTKRTPRVLCISGSPRRHGNSERLLDALIEGVEAAGGEAVKLVVRDAGIGVCVGCQGCHERGACVRKDGMDNVYRQLDSADAIAVASPVYFATVPAVLKTLLDRCQPYWARRYVLGQPRPAHKRPGAILIVGGGDDPFGAGCALTPVQSVFGVLSVGADHIIEVIGPDEPEDILGRPAALSEARAAGDSLVESVRSQL
jgi:multimeric flavodoxin WrbA